MSTAPVGPPTSHPGESALHRTLARQLRKLGLHAAVAPHASAWEELLQAVNSSYLEADDERYTLERSIDISSREMRGLHEVLRRQAHQDTLTGLPNRAALLAHLQSRLSGVEVGRVAVAALFIDLDGFKQVNDNLGHAAGDNLLVRAAERIRACLRPGDIVARLGGDEFVVVCDGADDPGVIAAIAARIGAQLAVPFRMPTQDAVVSASIGVALAGSGGDNPEDLLRRADLAMYDAKLAGKARTSVFDPAMQSDVDARTSLRTALGDAVRRDELRVLYQPLVRLSDHKIIGVEALVRWDRPGFGLLAPDSFVAVAQEGSLIAEVDFWVLTEAIRRGALWCRAGGTLSVNLSARTLESDALVATISSALTRYGVPASAIVLEITEVGLSGSGAGVDSTLHRLHDIGVGVSIDDFGTGSSSLSILARTAANVVKIDRSVVAAMDAEPSSASTVAAIIAVAKALGLTSVAEGVERREHADLLRGLGCDSAQGWLFGHPVPAAQIDEAFGLLAPVEPA